MSAAAEGEAAATPMDDVPVEQTNQTENDTTTPAAAATPAAESAGTLDDLMDGEDETAAEQIAADAAEAEAAAAGGEDAGSDEDGDAGGGGGGGGVDDSEVDEALISTLRSHLKVILANLDATNLGKLGVKVIMKQLKAAAGKKIIKQHKELAKRLAKEAAQARLDEVQAAAGDEDGDDDEEPAAEEEEEYSRPPIGDEEDDEEEERPTKKGKKRLRKAAGSDDEDEDGDYSEKRASKKSKSSSKSKKSSSSSSSSTAALLSIPTPKTAFVIFQQSERSKMREEHPDANSGEIQKLISEKWSELDPDSKGEYDAISRKQKEAYRQALLKLKEEDPEAYQAHLRASKKKEEDLLKDPSAKKKKKSSSSSGGGGGSSGHHSDDYSDDPDDGHDPESVKELSYFDSIVKDLKVRRQTKSELSAEEQKQVAEAFIQRMEDAVQADIDASTRGEPAFTRLNMLQDVQAQVSKPRVAELLLDEGLLKVLTRWIGPEVDGSLPNVKLRTVVYQLLAQLNINEENLSNSRGLGKRVMRLWKDPEETLSNKRLLESLIQKWMRPMLGLSTDYNKLSELDEERGREILNRKSLLDQQKVPHNYNPKRALLPQAAKFDYAIRPQANRDHEDEAEEARDASKAKRLEPVSRKEELKKKMDKMKRGSNQAKPRFKVDITGRASAV